MANPAGRSPRPDFEGAAEEIKQHARENIDTATLEADIKQLREDISRLTEQLAKTGSQSYGTARRAATEGVEHLKAQGAEVVDSLRDNAKQMEDQLAEKVREKPITAVAVAALVGYVFAVLRR